MRRGEAYPLRWMQGARSWRRRATGILVSVVAVALVTGAVFALRPVAPVLSLGVLYVVAVVAVAVTSGLAYAIPVSIASMLTFNFIFLPPVHTFALHDSANWVALAVYIAVAAVVSELATRSRRLARQAVEAETLRQSDAVKTAVLRAVSHDLRSPLTAIRAASEGLANPHARPERVDREDLVRDDPDRGRAGSSAWSTTCSTSRGSTRGPRRRRPELWTIDEPASPGRSSSSGRRPTGSTCRRSPTTCRRSGSTRPRSSACSSTCSRTR